MNDYQMEKPIKFTISEDKIFCDYGTLDYSFDENGAIVNSISVYNTRQGIGKKLVELFEDITKQANLGFIEVPVSPNKEAILFWKSLGYKPSSEDAKYWTKKILGRRKEGSLETIQGVVVMEKVLKQK
jgi:hypothetical protein